MAMFNSYVSLPEGSWSNQRSLLIKSGGFHQNPAIPDKKEALTTRWGDPWHFPWSVSGESWIKYLYSWKSEIAKNWGKTQGSWHLCFSGTIDTEVNGCSAPSIAQRPPIPSPSLHPITESTPGVHGTHLQMQLRRLQGVAPDVADIGSDREGMLPKINGLPMINGYN